MQPDPLPPQKIFDILSRFPLVLFVAILGTVAFFKVSQTNVFEIVTPSLEHAKDLALPLALFWASLLGIPLILALRLLEESLFEESKSKSTPWPLQLLGLLILALYFWKIFKTIESPTSYHQFRWAWVWKSALLVSASHLLIGTLPFIVKRNPLTFWQFHLTLVLRFLFAFLCAGILFLGCLALTEGVKSLFEVAIPDFWMAWLAGIAFGIVQTIIFLAGIPDPRKTNEPSHFFRHLIFFVRLVLIPILSLSVLILYGYSIRYLLGNLDFDQYLMPLIVPYSLVGILAYVFIYPSEKTSKTFCFFRIFFFGSLIPLLAIASKMMLSEIEERGLYEDHVLFLSFVIWMAGLSLYFLFSKKRNILWVPASLALILIFSVISPWNAENITVNYHLKRVKKIFYKTGNLENGKISTKHPLPAAELSKVEDSLDSIIKRQGIAPLYKIFETKDLEANEEYREKNLFYGRTPKGLSNANPH